MCALQIFIIINLIISWFWYIFRNSYSATFLGTYCSGIAHLHCTYIKIHIYIVLPFCDIPSLETRKVNLTNLDGCT